MASADHVNCKGVVQNDPVLFDNMTTIMKFLAIEGVPVDLLIRISELERSQTSLDIGEQFAEFKIRGDKFRVVVQPEIGSLDKEQRNSAEKDFTIDSSSVDEEVSGTELNDDKLMVFSIAKECATECKKQFDQELNYSKMEIVKNKAFLERYW